MCVFKYKLIYFGATHWTSLHPRVSCWLWCQCALFERACMLTFHCAKVNTFGKWVLTSAGRQRRREWECVWEWVESLVGIRQRFHLCLCFKSEPTTKQTRLNKFGQQKGWMHRSPPGLGDTESGQWKRISFQVLLCHSNFVAGHLTDSIHCGNVRTTEKALHRLKESVLTRRVCECGLLWKNLFY